MIIAILGGVGSGKTLSATKEIIARQQLTYTNFDIKTKNIIRLKKEHIISENIIRLKKNGEPVKEKKINWDYWNKAIKEHKGFDMVIDEIHNIVHSRMSMSKHNVLMSMWFSQIRKILGASEKNNIILISQMLSRIDVAFRDLLNVIIYCRKITINKKIRTRVRENGRTLIKNLNIIYVIQYIFTGENCTENYLFFRNNPKTARKLRLYKKTGFIGNPIFQFYDSYEIVSFGESVYL